jgi:hypothetical protein
MSPPFHPTGVIPQRQSTNGQRFVRAPVHILQHKTLDFERAVTTMTATQPKITFGVVNELYLLCIIPADLSTAERNRVGRLLG